MSPDRPGHRRRLFVAVEVDAAAQDAIDAALAPWRDALPAARWSPRDNRHVTVRFLGAVAAELAGVVSEAAAATAAITPGFDLGVAGPGRFPARGRARVLWVGLEDPAGALPALAAGLETRLPGGIRPETRAYAAHLTVARADPPLAVPGGWAETALAPVRWRVANLTVFESHLERPHARYEPLARFPLSHVAGPPAEPR